MNLIIHLITTGNEYLWNKPITLNCGMYHGIFECLNRYFVPNLIHRLRVVGLSYYWYGTSIS